MPENAGELQAKGRFQKGCSGNPRGKAKGTKNRATLAAEQLLQGELESICRRLIQEATSGNMQAIKMILDRVLPPKRNSYTSFYLPNFDDSTGILHAIDSIMKAVSQGNLSVEDAEMLTRMVDTYMRAKETYDYEERLSKFEQKFKT
jgi:hypothetical protein